MQKTNKIIVYIVGCVSFILLLFFQIALFVYLKDNNFSNNTIDLDNHKTILYIFFKIYIARRHIR